MDKTCDIQHPHMMYIEAGEVATEHCTPWAALRATGT